MPHGINRTKRALRQQRAAERRAYWAGLSDEQRMQPHRGTKVLRKLVKRQLQAEGRSA